MQMIKVQLVQYVDDIMSICKIKDGFKKGHEPSIFKVVELLYSRQIDKFLLFTSGSGGFMFMFFVWSQTVS